MKVDFGLSKFENKRTQKRDPVTLDLSRTINGHMMLAGASGTGKTYQLRRIMSEIARQDPEIRFHVLDIHGDLEVPGASSCKFSETSPFGVNPLKIDSDPHMGGVRKRARGFIASLNRSGRTLGSKQEATLYDLLVDLYAAFGFQVDDPSTWKIDVDPRQRAKSAKRQPTLGDLRAFAERRLMEMTTGAGSQALDALDGLNRKVRALQRKGDMGGEAETQEIARLRSECIDLYREYVEGIATGEEISQFIRHAGRDVLQSVYERVSNLESSGVFRPRRPDFDTNASVFRYDISAISREEQVLFVEFVAQELFFNARRRGQTDRPRHFIVLDESHAFVSQDPDHVLNSIIRESRKFGLGLILASQSLGDFPDDIIANTAAKVILGVDEMFHAPTARKLAIEQKRLTWIVPRKTALVQFKRAGDTSNRYIETELP